MCGKYVQASRDVSPGQEAPVVLREPRGRQPQLLRWGLVPSWAEEPPRGRPLINARAESLLDKPSFRGPFSRSRCLVPADAFYEWRKDPVRGKTRMQVSLRSGEPFAMAGLWDAWRGPGGRELRSFAIVTTEAAGAARDIHDRMPVILRFEDEKTWLDPKAEPARLRRLLIPFPEEALMIREAKPDAAMSQQTLFTMLLLCGLWLAPAKARAQALSQLRGWAPPSAQQDIPEVGAAGPALEESAGSYFPVASPVTPRPFAAPVGSPPPEPSARLRLADILDSHWDKAESVGSGAEGLRLGVHFNFKGEAFLAVKGAGWRDPEFLKFEAGMGGNWQVGGARYRLALDASLFRRKLDNYIVVYKNGVRAPVYRKRIQDLLVTSFESGREVSVGAAAYRLFYSYDLDGTTLDKSRAGVVLVRGEKDRRGEYAFTQYIAPASDLENGLAAGDFGGRRIGLRIASGTLELYDLTD